MEIQIDLTHEQEQTLNEAAQQIGTTPQGLIAEALKRLLQEAKEHDKRSDA
jgi:hypothetical protein